MREVLIRLIKGGTDIFGYFPHDHSAILCKSLTGSFGLPDMIENFPDWMLAFDRVASDSANDWKQLFESIHRGETVGSAMLTLRNGRKGFGRYWLRYDAIADDDGETYFVVFTVDDFTSTSRKFYEKDNDINGLLQAMREIYPEIITINLTRNSYRILQFFTPSYVGAPAEGAYTELLKNRAEYIGKEETEEFRTVFSPEYLRNALFVEMRDAVQLTYRRLNREGQAFWVETIVHRNNNVVNDDELLVLMTRSVEDEKAAENRLREQMRMQQEELAITLTQMGKVMIYFDISSGALTMPPHFAQQRGIPPRIEKDPELVICSNSRMYPDEAKAAVSRLFSDIRAGVPSGSCEYYFEDAVGAARWDRFEYKTIFDSEGKPMRAIIANEDVTGAHTQTDENLRLKRSQRVLRLVAQHSDREITYYDLDTGIVRYRNGGEEQTEHIDRFFESGLIQPDSIAAARKLINSVHDGAPSGEAKILVKNESGDKRWLDVKYSTLVDQEMNRVTTLFSFRDITRQYEHELAYLRNVRPLEEDMERHMLFLEIDLTSDSITKMGGKLLPDEFRKYGTTYTGFAQFIIENAFTEDDRQRAEEYFEREGLLALYDRDRNSLFSQWHLRFRDGTLHWLEFEVTMLDDPYTGNVRAYIYGKDVTEEVEHRLMIKARSERDGMTGLYNRATAEELIRRRLADPGKHGILMVLDLDDLKGINDNLGHDAGDSALRGISDTLRAHFRESDIIGRFGGDEFIIYLPGAATNPEAIAMSVAALLRKLASVGVGNRDERRIHCSMGCVTQTSDLDTFDELYKLADKALYHVKRHGKNSFAFYSPDMDNDDFQFKAKRMISLQNARKFELVELQYLLNCISTMYQLVMSVNISANDYYLMEEIENGVFSRAPAFGVLDDFVNSVSRMLHPDDKQMFNDNLSRQGLLRAYTMGEKTVNCRFRFNNQGEYLWTEANVIFYVNEAGDVCDFTLLRWIDEPGAAPED